MEFLSERQVRELVYGGAVLGAGGGGSIDAGLAAGLEALSKGKPRLAGIDELPSKALIATLSIVGSVTTMSSDQPHIRHFQALKRLMEIDKRPVRALITSEVGPQAVTYGWHESAVSGIPIADAPCNGRGASSGRYGFVGPAPPSHVYDQHRGYRQKWAWTYGSRDRPPYLGS